MRKYLLFFLAGILSLPIIVSLIEGAEYQQDVKIEKEKVMKWRKERDDFFKNHSRSPLRPSDRKRFKGLDYFPFDPQYYFEGQIRREILHINDPKYYATFLTNKGTNKRYIRYGKFAFYLGGKDYEIEIYKSILSDSLFIPFKDLTNGKETYEGGRYMDAEILSGYRMVLDFNMTYDPSCAYDDKFVCAIPPKENFLNVPIKAGQRNLKKE